MKNFMTQLKMSSKLISLVANFLFFFFFIFYKNVKTGTEKIRCILKSCRVISETTSDFSVPRQKDKRGK